MAGTFLQRRATATRVANTATVRGGDLSPPTDDLRLFDIAVEVDAGGGSVTIDIQGELDWINVATGVTNGQRVVTDEHGVAVRATWAGGSGGTMNVYASPKYNGAL